MIYTTWTPTYTPTNPTGVTSGTVSVPNWNDSDWTLVEAAPEEACYMALQESDNTLTGNVGTQVTVKTNQVKNPYNQLKNPSRINGMARIPALTSRSAYVKVVDLGMAQVQDEPETAVVAPVSVVLNVTIPDGVRVQIEDICSRVGIALSAMTRELDEGTTDPLSRVPEIIQGGVRISG